MALIKCSECGKEYSDKAPACPNCGNPTDGKVITTQQSIVVQKKKSSAWAWIVLIIVGIGAVGATGVLNNATASYNLDVTIDDGGVNSLGTCYVKGKITNNNEYDDYTECTLTFNLVNDNTKEYVGKAVTKFSTIKTKESLSFEASGVCDYSVKEAKWQYDIKCGDDD